jgi:hypothetical protein
MSDTIPLAILSSIAHAVDTVHVWNAAITQARAMEVVAHQPGRYEYDLRDTFAGKRLRERLDRALRTLDLLETRAQALGIPIEALYTACQGKPVLEPEGAAVREWRPRSTGAQPATPSPAGASAPP